MDLDMNALESKLTEYKGKIESALSEKSTKTDGEIESLRKGLDEIGSSLKSVQENLKAKEAGKIFNDKKDVQKFRISNLVKGLFYERNHVSNAFQQAGAGYELEAIEAMRKVATAGNASNLGLLIPSQVQNEIIDNVWAINPIPKLGCETVTDLMGDLYYPKIVDKPTAYWVGELETPTETDTSVGQIHLSPKKLRAMAKVSRDVMRYTADLAERIVRDQLVRAMDYGIGNAFCVGAGNAKQPQGLSKYASFNDISGTTASRFLIDHAIRMQTELEEVDESNEGSMAYLMRPIVSSGMKRERVDQFSGQAVGTGMPIAGLEMMASDNYLKNALGINIVKTTHIPKTNAKGGSDTATSVYYGDWSKMIVGIWNDMEIMLAKELYIANDEIGIFTFNSVDFGCKRESAFVKKDDVEATESAW